MSVERAPSRRSELGDIVFGVFGVVKNNNYPQENFEILNAKSCILVHSWLRKSVATTVITVSARCR